MEAALNDALASGGKRSSYLANYGLGEEVAGL